MYDSALRKPTIPRGLEREINEVKKISTRLSFKDIEHYMDSIFTLAQWYEDAGKKIDRAALNENVAQIYANGYERAMNIARQTTDPSVKMIFLKDAAGCRKQAELFGKTIDEDPCRLYSLAEAGFHILNALKKNESSIGAYSKAC